MLSRDNELLRTHSRWGLLLGVIAIGVVGMISLHRLDARGVADRFAPAAASPCESQARDVDLPVGVLRVFGDARHHTWGLSGGRVGMVISPDGNTIATSGPGHIQLTDLLSGEITRVIETEAGMIVCLAFSRDGRRIAFGTWDDGSTGTGTLEIVGLDGQTVLVKGAHDDVVSDVQYTQDGSKIISAGADGVIKLWDAESGELLQEIVAHRVDGKTSWVQLAISPDGGSVISGGGDGLVKTWNIDTGQLLKTLGSTPEAVSSVAISQDGSLVAAADQFQSRSAKIWEYESGALLHELQVRPPVPGEICFINSIAISPDRRFLAVGTCRNMGGTVDVYDLKTAQLQSQLDAHIDYQGKLAFTPDGRFLVSAGWDCVVKVWKMPTLQDQSPVLHRGPLWSVAFSADGTQLATVGMCNDAEVLVWNVQDGSLDRRLKLEQPQINHRAWCHVRFAPDGSRLAVAGPGIEMYSLETGMRMQRFVGGSICASVDFSDDGKLFATGTDANLTVRESRSGNETFSAQAGGRQGVSLTSDGRVLALSRDRFSAWDIEHGERLFEHEGDYWVMATGRDGRTVAVCRQEPVVNLYDGRTGEQRGSFRIEGRAFAMACSSDEKLLAIADDVGRVEIWDLPERAFRHAWTIGFGFHPVRGLAFSADSRYLATANTNGTAYLLEVPDELRR